VVLREQLDYAEKVRTQRRTQVVTGLFIVAFTAYLASLWYLQVIQGEAFRLMATENILRTVEVPAYRGTIRDRQGRVLVSNRLSFNVLVDREAITRRELLVDFLADRLALDPEVLSERLDTAKPRPLERRIVLAEDVTLQQAVSLETRQMEWPALSIEVHARRSYPQGRLAAHALGYVGEISEDEMRSGNFAQDLRGGDIVGKTGIERFFETDLQGTKGARRVRVNSRGRVVQEVGLDSMPSHGRDLRLTIDLNLQEELEAGLAGQVGAGIFLDPWTGEILAMASSPAFEPNLFARRFPPEAWKKLIGNPQKPLQNRVSLSNYSPGSTFKIVVGAAALAEKVVSPSTTIFCPGYTIIYNHRFRCWKEGGHGAVNLEEAIVHSCNVYFYQVGKMLGIEAIAAYANSLGLGQPTGIDLLNEDAGLIPTPEWKERTRGQPWYAGETISVAIGQGPLNVTPLQMARMAATLANGGRAVTPHLAHRGEVREQAAASRRRNETGFSTQTMSALRRAMVGVVQRGTGGRAAVKGIEVAGKTGTAQFSSRSAGIDADDLPYAIRDHAWFVGFAPAQNPRIAFAVFVEHGGHGGTTAAPVARSVMERFFAEDEPPVVPPLEQAAAPATAVAEGSRGASR
jgi:penicillin-binding protein 2